MDQMDQRETVKRTAGSMQHMLPGTRGDLLSIQSHDLNNELDLCCQTFLRRFRELHKAMVVKEWTRTKLPDPDIGASVLSTRGHPIRSRWVRQSSAAPRG